MTRDGPDIKLTEHSASECPAFLLGRISLIQNLISGQIPDIWRNTRLDDEYKKTGYLWVCWPSSRSQGLGRIPHHDLSTRGQNDMSAADQNKRIRIQSDKNIWWPSNETDWLGIPSLKFVENNKLLYMSKILSLLRLRMKGSQIAEVTGSTTLDRIPGEPAIAALVCSTG